MFGPATSSLIHANDIETRAIGLCRDAAHVARIAAAFKPMDQDHGGRRLAIVLPMAESLELRMRFDGKEARLLRQSGQGCVPRQVARDEGHEMSVPKGG